MFKFTDCVDSKVINSTHITDTPGPMGEFERCTNTIVFGNKQFVIRDPEALKATLNELRQETSFLSQTSNEELLRVATEISGIDRVDHQSVLRKTPLWDRWLNNGANIAQISDVLARLAGLFG